MAMKESQERTPMTMSLGLKEARVRKETKMAHAREETREEEEMEAEDTIGRMGVVMVSIQGIHLKTEAMIRASVVALVMSPPTSRKCKISSLRSILVLLTHQEQITQESLRSSLT